MGNFKRWAENAFGNVSCAFRAIDRTRSNSLSFPMFKRALKNFGFTGDTRVLFHSLKPDCALNDKEARLALKDLNYLASWETFDESGDLDFTDDEAAEDVKSPVCA